ncbi:MAG: fasciclin domain-containing protein, partial [Bacteroidota bacterium]
MKKLIYTLFMVLGVITTQAQTITDLVVSSDQHETLEDLVILAELDDDLASAGPFTLFAPTDAAFAALDPAVVAALQADPTGALADVLLYHVAAGTTLAEDLSDGDMVPTLLGFDANVDIVGMMASIDGANISVTNVNADNGVIHFIDAVMTPPTVVDVVVDSPVHESLEAAVIAADLAGTLSGDGPFTVFAPTDEAFGALGQETIDALFEDPTGDLADILLYHVVGAEALAGSLMDGDAFATILGPNIDVSIMDGTVMINDATVTVTDLETYNGVVHVINAVLTPPTVVDIIVDSPVHESLELAVIEAELAETLSGDGPFTVFAPTDAAFAELGQETIDALFADPTGTLADILLYHVTSGTALAESLSDDQMVPMLLGFDATVGIDGMMASIDGANISVTDIIADNGVVHVIDAVMTPPTVVDVVVNSEVHESLEAAVLAAELADDLSGAGPFTVFAPTDEAFAALGQETIDALFDDPTGDLANILLYHVVGAEALAGSLS